MMNKRITPEEALKRPNSTLPEIDETPPITINSLSLSGRTVRSGWSENTRIRTDGSPAGVSGRFLKIIDTTTWTLKRSMMKNWANRNREELGAVIISIVVALPLANGFADPAFVIWKSPPSPAFVGLVGKSVSEIKNALELS